jgi:hypothetical protein
MKSALGVAVFLVTVMFGADAAAQTIGVKVRRWEAEINGEIQVDDDGSDGSGIDVDDTFGFDEKEDFDELHVSLGLPLLGKINYQYLRGEYEGSRTLSANITFAGTTFTASNRIDAKLELEAHTLLWSFGASTPGVIGADIGAGGIAGVKYFDILARVDDEFGNSEDTRIRAPLPVIGAYVRTNLASFLAFEAQVHGIKFLDSFNLGLTGLFYDATVAVDLKFSGLFVGVGYRLMKLDIEYENGTDVDADLDLKGMFLEAGLSF